MRSQERHCLEGDDKAGPKMRKGTGMKKLKISSSRVLKRLQLETIRPQTRLALLTLTVARGYCGSSENGAMKNRGGTPIEVCEHCLGVEERDTFDFSSALMVHAVQFQPCLSRRVSRR